MDDWEKLERYEERFRPHFEVHTAPPGDYCIEAALEHRPDVILACLAFESMDARELQIVIREHEQLQQTPIVYMTEDHGENATESELDVILPEQAHFDVILSALQRF